MQSYSGGWLDFIKKVEATKEELDLLPNEECFFRGHADDQFKLTPGLFRSMKGSNRKISQKLWHAEADMFYEFRSRAKEIHNQNFTDWDILFSMQHHGVRTRLLDWTENLSVAIYFALLHYRKGARPCIWMLNPYKLNETFFKEEGVAKGYRDLIDPENLGYDGEEEDYYTYTDYLLDEDYQQTYDWDEPVAIYPMRLDNRLSSQGGYFTIHGNDVRPLEKILEGKKGLIKKILIPGHLVPSAQLFLLHAGVTHFSMFPDLDGLARYLNSKYIQI